MGNMRWAWEWGLGWSLGWALRVCVGDEDEQGGRGGGFHRVESVEWFGVGMKSRLRLAMGVRLAV